MYEGKGEGFLLQERKISPILYHLLKQLKRVCVHDHVGIT